MEIYCQTIQELPEVTKKIISYGTEYSIWVLKGDLGAGKTTFIQEVARQMNVMDNISSPSYALINEYITHQQEKIYHFDLFRVKSISEVLDLGFDEYLETGSRCFIEWPELGHGFLPEPDIIITLETSGEGRLLEFKTLTDNIKKNHQLM